ncbi:hypothetical protein ACP0SG_08635, partial [Campylobacter lari]|uniref:hypothetical protein n=2 Tax=Campylobacter lari TaxID=201 RepID=UPI003DA13312
PFNNSINVVFNALNQRMNKALAIKSYSEVPVDVSAFANYTCNGYELTYQPINLGDYAIPNTDKVKSVTIKWKGAVDDRFGITIHDTFVDGRIFRYEWIDNWYQGNVKVKWNKVNKINIKAGAINTAAWQCYARGIQIHLRFNYDE